MIKAIQNTLANYAGGIVTLAAMLVFNAIYFRMVSEEHFGLISLLLTATLMVPALDLGTARTAGRIIAGERGRKPGDVALRDAVITWQIVNGLIGAGLGVLILLAAPFLARSWFESETLAPDEIRAALIWIALCVPLVAVRNFSSVCLNNLKRQGIQNLLYSLSTIVRGLGGLVALEMDSADLTAFFVSQAVLLAVELLVTLAIAWKLLPGSGLPGFRGATLAAHRRFALADGGASLIGVGLTQGDKILLSAVLPLSAYGAYALISTVAIGIARFTSPFAAAFLPHFVELWAVGRHRQLRRDYLVATQLLSCVILPLAAVAITYAAEIVAAILGSAEPAPELALAFALLVAATILGNLMYLPHGVQLSAGNSGTAFRFNAVGAPAYIVMVAAGAGQLGVLAPAISLFVVYAVSLVLFARVTHRTLQLGDPAWFGHSVALPLIGAAAVPLLSRLVYPDGAGMVGGALWLVLVAATASLAALALCPRARKALLAFRGARKAEPAGPEAPAPAGTAR